MLSEVAKEGGAVGSDKTCEGGGGAGQGLARQPHQGQVRRGTQSLVERSIYFDVQASTACGRGSHASAFDPNWVGAWVQVGDFERGRALLAPAHVNEESGGARQYGERRSWRGGQLSPHPLEEGAKHGWMVRWGHVHRWIRMQQLPQQLFGPLSLPHRLLDSGQQQRSLLELVAARGGTAHPLEQGPGQVAPLLVVEGAASIGEHRPQRRGERHG